MRHGRGAVVPERCDVHHGRGDGAQRPTSACLPVVPKPLKFSGTRLEFNYSTSGADQIRVELQDASGQPIPGHALEDCDPIKGGAIAGHATWKENSNLSPLAGKPIRLRFVMNEADLYSIRFTPEKH